MRILASLIALSAATGWAWADGNQSFTSANASVSLWPPITLTKCQDLWFGEVILDTGFTGGQIEQNAAKGGGTREPDTQGIQTVQKHYNRWNNAEFEVSGNPRAGFSVVLPQYNSVFITNTSTGAVIPIQLGVPEFDTYAPSSIGATGKTKIWVGGKLTLPTTPTPGYYHGQFSVTVAYN